MQHAADWNPGQYARYRDERSRPFFDLLALVQPWRGTRAVDLGCGTGELTRVLHDRLALRETVGVDSSPAMLAQSGAFAGNGVSFRRGDIADFPGGERFDLIFSNAALQWLPDHAALLARIGEGLGPGGQLAVQVPANHDHPSHRVAAEVAREEPFRAALDGYARRFPVLPPEAYATVLDALGFRDQHVRLQVYAHHLTAREDVVEWVRGSLLTDYEKRMPADLFPAFLARYREVLLPRLADTRPFLYPFKRILLWGQRA